MSVYYKAFATLETTDLYGVKHTHDIESREIDYPNESDCIKYIKEWIISNRRLPIVHGMGDKCYPEMKDCKIYKITKECIDFDLQEYFKTLDEPKVRHYNPQTHQYDD